jgi:hypothetical protein
MLKIYITDFGLKSHIQLVAQLFNLANTEF